MFDFWQESKAGMGGAKIRKVNESNPEELCQSSFASLW